jgi:hypothetical protein
MDESERKSPQGLKGSSADEAMKALTRLFSSREIAAKAHFRCSIEGPTDFDVLFESMLDQLFGRNPSSNYKCWVRRLYRLGLVSALPNEWKAQDAENSAQSGQEIVAFCRGRGHPCRKSADAKSHKDDE